jgi:hypothetical protein
MAGRGNQKRKKRIVVGKLFLKKPDDYITNSIKHRPS